MAPTKEELLIYLRQLHTENPQMTKEELSAKALAHFSQKTEIKSPHEVYLPAGKPISMMLADRAVSVDESRTNAMATTPDATLGYTTKCLPSLNKKAVIVTLVAATLFSIVVMAGIFLLTRYTPFEQTNEEVFASVAALRGTPPVETGEIARFGKRFAGNSSYYNEKFSNQVLEIVGYVDIVERNVKGELLVTLLAVDQSKNIKFRAQFRFLPEQHDGIQLARGTLAVLKGKYTGYKDGTMSFYPSVIVYNSADLTN